MHKEKFNISLISECSIFIKFDESISENAVGELARSIRETFASIVMNVVPSYQTILIDYLPFRINEKNLVNELQQIVSQFDTQSLKLSQPNHITIPVYYSEETALDLISFSKARSVIRRSYYPAYENRVRGFCNWICSRLCISL